MTLEIEPISNHQGHIQRNTVLAFVVIFFCIYGAIDSQASTYPKIANVVEGAIIPLFVAIAIFWCMIEKRMKGEVLGFWWVFGMFFAAPIILLIFFFKERGTKGGFIFTAKFIALNLLLVVVATIGSMVGKYAVTT